MSGTAIVVGMSGSTGLAVVRALAREDVTCHAVHYDAAAPAMATRLARKHTAPDWRADPGSLVEFLLDLAARLGLAAGVADAGLESPGGVTAAGGVESAAPTPGPSVASLFVCHDAALGPAWAGAGRLRAAGVRPAFSAARPLAELLDKRNQLEAAARAGVAVPWTRWGSPAELEAAADECLYPAILKPAFSHLGVKALGAKALRCADAAELRDALERVGDIELLLQEYVPGGDDQLYTAGLFVCADGHLAFTGRKLKQHPPGLGIARLAEAVDEPDLVPGGIALLAELGYEGISQVEYKRDVRDGGFRLMEANFRPWTWIGLATACGTNLPLAAHRWTLGDDGWREAAAARVGRSPRQGLAAASPGAPPRRRSSPELRRWVWLLPETTYTVRDLRHGVRPRLAQWRGVRAEAFFSRADPAPLRRALTAALDTRLHRWTAAAGPCRRAARAALMLPAAIANTAVLWAEWRRAGRRSVAGVAPARGLPAPGAVLVLAPHPDDETLMCGATLAALRRRGDPVRVVGLTSGAATRVGRHTTASAPGATAPASALSPSPAPPAAPGMCIGDVRAAELHAACAVLGVDDVDLWDFTDGGLSGERGHLAVRLRDELDRVRPDFIVVPFPYDAHADHVAATLALADALEIAGPGAGVGGREAAVAGGEEGEAGGEAVAASGDERDAGGGAAPVRILCGAVRTPLSPCWATRLVPAGAAWARRRAALRAHASRDAALFATPTLLAHLHPAHFAQPAEGFVDLSVAGFLEAARAMDDRGLTVPAVRGGGHPVTMAAKLLRTRAQRDEVTALLGSAARR